MFRVVTVLLLALLVYHSYGQASSLLLQSQLFNLSLSLQQDSAENAAKRCVNSTELNGPGVLAPATLLLYVLQDIISKNTAQLQTAVKQDPVQYNTGGSSLWVLDPWGSCRAVILPARLSSYTGAVELSLVPCSWTLQYMCMEYSVAQALSAGLTLPHNLYRTPTPPPLPVAVPSHGGDAINVVPPGYRLVRSGITLGYSSLPAGAVFFTGRLLYQQLGPVVNLVGRWRATGLDALRLVNANDATNVVEQAMANGTVADYFGSTTLTTTLATAWAATPLPREDASVGWLRTSHITRLEGCSSSIAVQRLLLVNAGGAAAAQGVTRCISNFAEEVAPGGFLAFLEGYYVDFANSTVEFASAPSIVQLWFVWAIPENYNDADVGGVASYPAASPGEMLAAALQSFSPPSLSPPSLYGTGGVRAIAPRLTPPEPTAQCTQGRRMIPPDSPIRNRAECGQSSAEQFACPSYMCCGTTRGRVGICGMAASACLLSACDPRYGLCGVIPNEALEVTPHEGLMGVAPAPSPLSSAPPYITDFGDGSTSMATATVRYGSSVYVLDRSASVTYSAALEACRSQALYGLSWRLIMLPDAFSYEVTLLGRSTFLSLLDNRVAWVQPRPDDSTLGVPGCLTVTWNVDMSSVQLVAVQASECSSIASVICKATWPTPKRSIARNNTSSSPPPQVTPARWTRGVHSLSTSLVGVGQPNSGPSCAFESFGGWQRTSEVLQAMSQVNAMQTSISAGSSVPVPLLLNITLDSPIAGIAIRPLVTWSAVSFESAAAYQAVGSIAVQYLTVSGGEAALAPPIILGSLDGTYLSDNMSYGAVAPAAPSDVASYLSSSAGWKSLQLNVTDGEVVVEVLGCRGALLEQLLLRTSTGKLWAAPIGAALTCSVPFSRRPPPGGYLVALQVFGGSFVEEVWIVWGTPSNPPTPLSPAATGPAIPVVVSPATPPRPVTATPQVETSSSTKHQRTVVFGVGVSFAVVLPILAGAIFTWWVCRSRYRQRHSVPAAAAMLPSQRQSNSRASFHRGQGGAISSEHDDGGAKGRGCLGLLGDLAEGARHGRPLWLLVRIGNLCAGGGNDFARLDQPGDVRLSSSAGVEIGASPWITTTTPSGTCKAHEALPRKSDAVPPLYAVADMTVARTEAVAATTAAAAAMAAMATTAAAPGAADGADGYGNPESTRRKGSESSTCAVGPDVEIPIQFRLPSGSVAMAPAPSSDEHHSPLGGTTIGIGTISDGSGNGNIGSHRQRVCAADVIAGPEPWSSSASCSVASQRIGVHGGEEAAAASAASIAAWASPLQPPQQQRTLASLGCPGQPVPPPGSEAWAQSLHAALLYKVLYHWKPPSLATPLVVPGPGPGAGLAAQPPSPPGPPPAAVAPVAAAPAAGDSDRATAAFAAAGTAPSLSTTSIVPSSSIAAPLTSSGGGGGGGSGGSGITHRSTGQLAAAVATPLTQLLAAAAASYIQAAWGAANGVLSPAVLPQPLGTTATGSTNASGVHDGDLLAAGVAAATAAPPPSGSDAGPCSRSRQADASAAIVGSAAAAPAGAGPVAAGASGGCGGGIATPLLAAARGEYDGTELLLGRDVLVDVDDPSSYLGHGTSGVVRRGLLLQPDGTWRPVAVKLLNQPNDQAIDAYRRHQKTLLQEITILGSLRHPNIVQLLGGSVSLHPGASFLVEELCGRTLSHAIYDVSTPYSLRQVLLWCCDIARGLAYLHPNIMHRDLKPSNVLLDQYGTAKISDFGLARFKIHTTLVTRDAEVGTTCYMSPECFVSNDFKVTAACDVYSLGVMMNEMVTRQLPWSGVRTAVVGFKVAVVGDRPRLPEENCPLCPSGLRDLIRACWAQHPEERPSSAEVLRRLQVLLAEVEAAEEAGGDEVGKREADQKKEEAEATKEAGNGEEGPEGGGGGKAEEGKEAEPGHTQQASIPEGESSCCSLARPAEVAVEFRPLEEAVEEEARRRLNDGGISLAAIQEARGGTATWREEG
ncbi:hypothetical protein Vretimale_1334 [Volvox reticuliferus]|uniref:Protein kinase domain-containing protein n=1 Tax=Volvox reticuliferus TaxID=1737510 RepID=A0A8J4D570_9CHLO|nr:hypothetical protein Vretifemale_10714 [Volvox reticuliferus]GIL95252.1 hypothetical protein Vretimale_1334 [Volvox reticuliferus]